jgi:hypothetical protein
MILSLFNKSEDPLSNSEMVKISISSISSIDFDRNKYKLFFIFIYYCPDVLVLIKMNESDRNKEFINFYNDFFGYFRIHYNFPKLMNG